MRLSDKVLNVLVIGLSGLLSVWIIILIAGILWSIL